MISDNESLKNDIDVKIEAEVNRMKMKNYSELKQHNLSKLTNLRDGMLPYPEGEPYKSELDKMIQEKKAEYFQLVRKTNSENPRTEGSTSPVDGISEALRRLSISVSKDVGISEAFRRLSISMPNEVSFIDELYRTPTETIFSLISAHEEQIVEKSKKQTELKNILYDVKKVYLLNCEKRRSLLNKIVETLSGKFCDSESLPLFEGIKSDIEKIVMREYLTLDLSRAIAENKSMVLTIQKEQREVMSMINEVRKSK